MKSEICLLMIAFFQVSQSLILPRDTVIVGEGESCGGSEVPRICDTGLTCLTPIQDPNGPIIADLPGTCRATANIVGEGESCQGEALPENVKYCNDGLICVFPDTINELPDLPGVCQRPGVTSSTSSIEATDTSSTVSQPTATPVGEGESCGGSEVPRICDTGLTCLTPIQDPNGPIIADLPGTCRTTANIVGEGESCQGEALPENVKYCNDGLICVFPDTINELPDLPGVCQRPGVTSSTSTIEVTDTSSTVSQPTATPVGEGESCGGFGGFSQVPRICDTGLTCLTPTQDPNGPIIADLPGICRATANIVGEGESCQGEALPENVKYCNDGLICVFPDTINELPDLPGVCQRPGVTFSTSSIEATGTSSIEATGTSSVVETGTSSVVETGTSSIVETGTSSIVETGTSSVVETGTSSIVETGTSSVEATGTSSIEATGTSSLTTRASSIVTSQTSVTVSTSTERIVVDHSTDLVRSTYTTSKVVQTTTYYATESDVVISSAGTLSCFGIAGLLAFLLF